MQCPSCRHAIGIFSRAANQPGRLKQCPKCRKPFKIRIAYGRFFVIAFPLALAAGLLLRGFAAHAMVGVVVVLAMLFAVEAVAP